MQETLNFSLTVNPAVEALKIVDAQGNVLEDGASVDLQPQTVGVESTQVLFTVSGGTAPYVFSLTAGTIPNGDTINSTVNADSSETVTIEGTPTTEETADFSITVADAAGASRTLAAKRKKIS